MTNTPQIAEMYQRQALAQSKGGKKGKKGKDLKRAMEEQKDKKTEQSAPFRVRDVNLTIPRGQLVAIVGPVGSGKVVCIFICK